MIDSLDEISSVDYKKSISFVIQFNLSYHLKTFAIFLTGNTNKNQIKKSLSDIFTKMTWLIIKDFFQQFIFLGVLLISSDQANDVLDNRNFLSVFIRLDKKKE